MRGEVRAFVGGAVLVAATSLGSAAGAVTLDIHTFARADLVGAQALLATLRPATVHAVIEDFETFDPWGVGDGSQDPVTRVGTFTAIGGVGSGSSVIGDPTKLQVRNDRPMAWNRQNTDVDGSNWLDSNDTYGIRWDIPVLEGLAEFDSLSFILTDVADVGAKFSVTVDGGALFHYVFDHMYLFGHLGLQEDGGIHVIDIRLPQKVSTLTVLLQNDSLNDGTGIDSLRVALIAVPLPAAGWLLISGAGLIAGVGMRHRQIGA